MPTWVSASPTTLLGVVWWPRRVLQPRVQQRVSEGPISRNPTGGSRRLSWEDRPAGGRQGAVPVTQHSQTASRFTRRADHRFICSAHRCGGGRPSFRNLEATNDVPERSNGTDLAISKLALDAECTDEIPRSSQIRPGHRREQVVLDLVVQSSKDESRTPATGHISRRDDLSSGKAHGRIAVEKRHALVVGGEADAEVEGEDRLMNRDEGNRHWPWQDPQHQSEVGEHMRGEKHTLGKGGTVPAPQKILDTRNVQTRAAQEHQWEEEHRLPSL